LIASIFDVIGYRTVEQVGRKTVTANLNTNFRQSIPIGSEFVTFTSTRLTGERKAVTHMAMFDTKMTTLYADATALFITPKEWVGKTSFDYDGEIQQLKKTA
jgi:acyl-coenzyme A thioesterase PaaI-like protein